MKTLEELGWKTIHQNLTCHEYKKDNQHIRFDIPEKKVISYEKSKKGEYIPVALTFDEWSAVYRNMMALFSRSHIEGVDFRIKHSGSCKSSDGPVVFYIDDSYDISFDLPQFLDIHMKEDSYFCLFAVFYPEKTDSPHEDAWKFMYELNGEEMAFYMHKSLSVPDKLVIIRAVLDTLAKECRGLPYILEEDWFIFSKGTLRNECEKYIDMLYLDYAGISCKKESV